MKDIAFLRDGKKLTIGDFSYQKNGDNVILTRYAGHKSRVEVPVGVTDLADESFSGARIKQVVLPQGVRTVGKKAFYCSTLQRIELPSSVALLGERAFDCSSIRTISIKNPEILLESEIFDHAYEMTEILFDGTPEQWENVFYDQTYSASFVVRFSDGTTKRY